MQRYESKQAQINRSAETIYTSLSNFSNFTPILQGKVEEWSATEDSCSFKAKGFKIGLMFLDKEPFKTLKIGSSEVSPIPFTFWLQLKELNPTQTRIRIVLELEMNMMLKMMLGNKLQDAVDQMAEKIAESFNQGV